MTRWTVVTLVSVLACAKATVDSPYGDPVRPPGDASGSGDTAGDPQSGDPQAGDPQSGDPQAGDPQSGDPVGGDAGPTTFDLSFSTYFGGTNWEHARDVFVGANGAVTIVGGTVSTDFPTTLGAYQRTQDQAGSQVGSGGYCDGFVAQFDASGSLLWSTYLGGPNYDRVYAVEVDGDGYVYVAGRAGPGFPVTSGAFQETFQGFDAGIYGQQNAFVAKLEADGSDLVWASYAGVASLSRDLAIDTNGDIYLPIGFPNQGTSPPSSWYTGAFQSTTQGGTDSGVMKVSSDGSQVVWATWIGGSGDDSTAASVRVDTSGNVYLSNYTDSTDLPTPNGADTDHNGGWDRYLAKLSSDGSSLIYGTYLGGSGNEFLDTHNLAVDAQGNAYVSTVTASSTDFPTTAGVVQQAFGGGNNDIAVTKYSASGALMASTLIGGSGDEGPDGIYASGGEVFVAGFSTSTDFPIAPSTAYQTQKGTSADVVLVVLSADLETLVYSTFLGGSSYDYGRSGFLDAAGNVFVTGSVDGSGWPTVNPHQATFAGGSGQCTQGGCYAGDVILAKLARQ